MTSQVDLDDIEAMRRAEIADQAAVENPSFASGLRLLAIGLLVKLAGVRARCARRD